MDEEDTAAGVEIKMKDRGRNEETWRKQVARYGQKTIRSGVNKLICDEVCSNVWQSKSNRHDAVQTFEQMFHFLYYLRNHCEIQSS